MGHRSVSGDAEEAGGCFWAVVTRGPKTAVPPSPGEGRKVSGTHHPVFSRGTTELTQPPWPCCLTAPCLSLPPMCASACLCQAVCRGRAQASIQGPRAQSLPVCPAPASPGLAQTVPPARLWPGPLFLCCVDLSPRGSPSCPLLLPLFLSRAARPLRKHTHTPIIQFGDGPFSPWGEEGRTLSRGQGPRGPSCGRDPTGSQLCSCLAWAPPRGYCCRKQPPGQRSPGWKERGWRLAGAATRNVCPGAWLFCLWRGRGQMVGGPRREVLASASLWNGSVGVFPESSSDSCPLLPKAPARGGSPRVMRSSLSVAAQSPGQGIQ